MTEPTIDTIVSELREAYEAATGGEWEIHSDDFDTAIRGPKSGPGWYEPITDSIGDKDAELIVKAHNYLPRLLSELEGLSELVRRAAEIGKEWAHIDDELIAANAEVTIRDAEIEHLRERLSRFETVNPWYYDESGSYCISGLDCTPFRRGYKEGDLYVSLPGSTWQPTPRPDEPEKHEPLCPWADVGE